jgi:hypothetical protein
MCPVGFYCPAYDSAECGPVDTDCNACADDACKKAKCWLFPIRWEENKLRTTPGATQKSDCTLCPDGYYWLSGSNIKKICPRGFYCDPNTTEKVTPCTAGTANPLEGQYVSTAWVGCGAGYLCNKAGIADKENFRCPLGYYCDQATTTDANMKKWAAGTYRDTTGAAAAGDCHQWPAGYYCELGQITPIPCQGGKYCPAGSSAENDCAAGTYCHEKFPAQVDWPAAFYCPALTDIYPKCREHYYCPINSTQETACEAGYIGWGNPMNENNQNISTADGSNHGCTECDPGTYSTADIIGEWPICPAGYVCSGNTKSATPTNSATDNGFECPAGFYCPAGSGTATPCPAGTFRTSTLGTALSSCSNCPSGTFGSQTGQTTCENWGGSSKSSAGATTCECVGRNRKYMPDSKTCVCIDGYESIPAGNEESDGSSSCTRRTFSTWADTNDNTGSCVSTTESCYTTCGSLGGTRVLGWCQCKALDLVNNVCNAACRSSRNKFYIDSNGDITIQNSSGNNSTQAMSAITNLYGSVSCTYSNTAAWGMVSIGLTGNSMSANYEASSGLSGKCGTWAR